MPSRSWSRTFLSSLRMRQSNARVASGKSLSSTRTTTTSLMRSCAWRGRTHWKFARELSPRSAHFQRMHPNTNMLCHKSSMTSRLHPMRVAATTSLRSKIDLLCLRKPSVWSLRQRISRKSTQVSIASSDWHKSRMRLALRKLQDSCDSSTFPSEASRSSKRGRVNKWRAVRCLPHSRQMAYMPSS